MSYAKVGIFGGSFNPLHLGHINSIQSVKDKLGLDTVRVVPANQSPNRKSLDGPTPDQRLEMVFKGLQEYSNICEVDDIEILRGGTSYTVDTLRSYVEDNPAEDLYLIIGVDQFEEFDRWSEYKEILSLANLVVTSRPGGHLPKNTKDFPKGVAELVEEFKEGLAIVKNGKTIQFIQLNDMDISATEVRKRLREGESVEEMLPTSVRSYIRKNELYESLGRAIGDFEKFTLKCGQMLFGKSGIMVRAFDLREISGPSEFSLIASGTSTRHTSALAEAVIKGVKTVYGVYPQNSEGLREGRWVVLDYGSLIIHIFYDYVRMEYQLERLWEKGKEMALEDSSKKL